MSVSHHSQTMRVDLKRKFGEVDDSPCYSSSPVSSISSTASSEWESDGESSSSDSQDFIPHSPASPTSLPIQSILKRTKLTSGQNSVRFDLVMVFSFSRCQGFTSVPSHGGATLGMAQRHSAFQKYTVAEHAQEQQHRRRERLQEKLTDQRQAARLTGDHVPDTDNHLSDAEVEGGGVLQPYSSRQRQVLLQVAGVKRIDKEEKRQLHALRLSREACGCDCQGFCESETCTCSLAGIKCQVDRFNFPCGCTKDGCENTQGRIEFDPTRVQTHYIHTVMKLELEQQLQDEALSPVDHTGFPDNLQEYEDQDETHPIQKEEDKSCPFGLSTEEDGLPLTMPFTPSFHFVPERAAVEENSCSSDMTESSCSSASSEDSSAKGFLRVQNHPEGDDGVLSCALSICDSENNDLSVCSQLRHVRQTASQQSSNCVSHSTTGDRRVRLCPSDNTQATDYLDENANRAKRISINAFLDGFPRTPSPSADCSSSSYMDLSLSSDSDLEFFDIDFPSGPLHSSFKGHKHLDCFHHLQLLSSAHFPQYDSSTFLLESLIGLCEPGTEQVQAATQNLLL